MIIWINGPYGVGKTTLAQALQEKLANSFLFDAEKVGDAVRDNLPEQFFRETYEEFPLWHEMCFRLLQELDASYGGTVLVPMTLTEPVSERELLQKLRDAGVDVLHVILDSDYETVRTRILARGEEAGCWCMEQIGRCQQRLAEIPCDLRLRSVGETAQTLAQQLLAHIRK